MKLIACFATVGLHTLGKESSEINRILYFICGFAMPIFFMVHGYFLLNRQGMCNRYLILRGMKILLVVFAWNTILSAAYLIFGKEIHNPFEETFNVMMLQKGFFMQFWFFGAILLLYVITPWLHRKIEEKNYLLLIILIIISVSIDIISMYYCREAGQPVQSYVKQPFRIWTWIMYYYLGGLLKTDVFSKIKNLKRTRLVKFFAAVFLVNIIYEYAIGYTYCGVQMAEYFYDNFFLILEATLLFVLFENIEVCNKKINSYIVQYTNLIMGVFIIHIIVKAGIRKIYLFSNPIVNIIMWALVFIVSLYISKVIKKIPHIKKLIEI